MKLKISQSRLQAPYPSFLRSAGYIYIESRHTGKGSFARPLSRGHYPRFHIYVDERGEELTFNIHLDQKQTSYEGVAAHSGEYEDEGPVREEVARLEGLLSGQSARPGASAPASRGDNSNPWSKLKRH